MASVRHHSPAVVIGMATFLFAQEAIAATKFASDEVSSAAKDPVVAQALAARGKLDEGIADYRGMRYTIASREALKENLLLLTLDCVLPDGQHTQMKLPTFRTESGWKVVLIDGYDHL